MKTRIQNWPLIIAMSLLAALPLAGCSEESPTGPGSTEEAPVLPDPSLLAFDFSFFDAGAEMDPAKHGAHGNFINAYLRAVILNAMSRLVMLPPVTAFAAALHSIPSQQDDGSWIWVYTHVDGNEEAQIRLRGMPRDEAVDWELRVTILHAEPPLDQDLWFSGTTTDDGETGTWIFHDLEDPDQPVSGEIAWGGDTDGRFLRFTSREPESDGDMLTFRDNDPEFAITFTDQEASQEWFIHWNADGHGSLLVPDFNGGEEACWDTEQHNVNCR